MRVVGCRIGAGVDGLNAILQRETCLTELHLAGTSDVTLSPALFIGGGRGKGAFLTARVRQQTESRGNRHTATGLGLPGFA